MALKTLVKVGNVTNLSDARYCAGMGVDLIGFVIDENSENYVSPEKLKEILSWLAGVEIVGEINHTPVSAIAEYLGNYEMDIVQISDVSLIQELKNLGKKIILRLEFENPYFEEFLVRYQSFVHYFLVEGGEFSDFAQKTLKEYAQNYPILLGFGVDATNVQHILNDFSFKGIALKGTNEIRPGYKDYDELSDILELIEID